VPAKDSAATTLQPEPTGNGGWDEWLTLFANRNEVADEYARMLRLHGVEWGGYRFVNEAILRRWSPAGLRYIKERAWKIASFNVV
jgi:hypothetical protein